MENRIKLINLMASLIIYAAENGIRFIITAFYRTPDEQNALFKKGFTKCDGYIKKSKHQMWRAFDVVLVADDDTLIWDHAEDYDTLGAYWKGLGGTWGGDWVDLGDIYHFEV